MHRDHRRVALMVWAMAALLALCALPIAAQAAAPSLRRLTLNATSVTLGLSDYNNTAVLRPRSATYSDSKTDKAHGFPADLSYASGNEAVVAIEVAADGTATLRAVAPGKATVGAIVDGRVSARCSVTVKSVVKATSIKLNIKSKTRYYTSVYDDPLNDYRSLKLTPTISPKGADANGDASLIQFTSSKPSVAEVDAQGNVLAVKAGTAVITTRLLDGSKKSAKCTVTVKALPALSISLPSASEKLQPNGKIQLEPTLSPATILNKGVKYTSSNKKVATVSSAGVVKAVAPGTARITVAAKSRTSVKTTFTVTVDYKYRFFAISNGAYKKLDAYSQLENWKPDLAGMNRAYKAARFDGGQVKINYKTNLTANGMRSYLNAIANYREIEPDDVTIFYYSGHGVDDSWGAGYNGALVGVDLDMRKPNVKALVRISELTSYLSRIPGQVIVILDSCYSGEFITAKSTNQRILQQAQLRLINDQIVSAFESASAGRQRGGVMTAKDLTPSTTAQFHVITGSANNQESIAAMGIVTDLWPDYTMRSLLTYCIEEGTSGAGGAALRADANGDGKVSLNELYLYAKPRVQELLARSGYVQDVQVWPANDSFAAFALN